LNEKFFSERRPKNQLIINVLSRNGKFEKPKCNPPQFMNGLEDALRKLKR
jgi:hypothetical protein